MLLNKMLNLLYFYVYCILLNVLKKLVVGVKVFLFYSIKGKI